MAIRSRPEFHYKGGSAPVPDPAAQTAADKSANRYNVVGPSGSTTWQQGRDRQIMGYDQNGKPIYGTTDTQTTTLSPEAQKQYNLSNQIATEMLQGSADQIKPLADKQYQGPSDFDYNTATPDAAKAAYTQQIALMQPDFEKSDRTFESNMANAGIPVGSEAYNDALRQHENDKNFALTDAAAKAQGTGADMAFQTWQANQNKNLQTRQQQYNEIAAALGGGQIAPVGAYSGGAGAPVNVAGAYGNANAANLANYNAGVETQNANTQAGVGLAGTAVMAAVIF